MPRHETSNLDIQETQVFNPPTLERIAFEELVKQGLFTMNISSTMPEPLMYLSLEKLLQAVIDMILILSKQYLIQILSCY